MEPWYIENILRRKHSNIKHKKQVIKRGLNTAYFGDSSFFNCLILRERNNKTIKRILTFNESNDSILSKHIFLTFYLHLS